MSGPPSFCVHIILFVIYFIFHTLRTLLRLDFVGILFRITPYPEHESCLPDPFDLHIPIGSVRLISVFHVTDQTDFHYSHPVLEVMTEFGTKFVQ